MPPYTRKDTKSASINTPAGKLAGIMATAAIVSLALAACGSINAAKSPKPSTSATTSTDGVRVLSQPDLHLRLVMSGGELVRLPCG